MAKEQHPLLSSSWISLWLLLFFCSFFFILKLNVHAPYRYTGGIRSDSSPYAATEEYKIDPCVGRYIYVHDLPPKFNEAILEECEIILPWMNMCLHFKNNGFGPEIEDPFSNVNGWYETNQFTLELIFKNRMEHYDCLTRDSSIAAAVYVPFYPALDFSRHLSNTTQVRDALSLELADWLRKTPQWKIMGGKDHFVVAGRVQWDFRRFTENIDHWGDKFLLLPEIKNMSTLIIESSPFHSNDFAIPYPTHFHPSNDAQLLFWQEKVRKLKPRNWLFSFTGAARPYDPRSIRSDLIDQCKHSKMCNHLECAGEDKNCDSPRRIIGALEESIFCLQPPGDTPTRRSTFDSILAGCIPVFFHPASAYTQYTWHFPKNYTKYSVFISEEGIRNKSISIEEILRRISPQQIEEMRREVIDLIPKIVYADPRSKSRTFKDAFDIALEGVIRRVNKMRREIVNSGSIRENLHEELSWKYSLFEDDDDDSRNVLVEKPHEWDSFFKFP